MRISRHDLRRRYSNSLVIDASSQFSLRACSQATTRYIPFLNWNCHMPDHKLIDITTWLTNNYQLTLLFPNGKLDSSAQCN